MNTNTKYTIQVLHHFKSIHASQSIYQRQHYYYLYLTIVTYSHVVKASLKVMLPRVAPSYFTYLYHSLLLFKH